MTYCSICLFHRGNRTVFVVTAVKGGLIRASLYLIHDKSCLDYLSYNIEILNSGQCLDNSSDNKILTMPGQHRVKTSSNNTRSKTISDFPSSTTILIN